MTCVVTEKVTRFYGCQVTTSNSVKQHKLRKLIAWLSDKESRGKEFISLYIPPQVSLDEIIAALKKESDCATDETGRNSEHLQTAVKSVIQHLKQRNQIPDYGLAIFAGLILENQQDWILNVEELIPPTPITRYQNKIDDHFWLEPLRKMSRDQRITGIIAVDSKQANFGLLNGERFFLLEDITSGVPGKTGKGGQSQRRYEREREMEVTAFFHRVAEHAAKAFLEQNKVTILLVGGPGQTKNDFLKGSYLHYELKNRLLYIADTKSAGRDAVREILDKSSEAMMTVCLPEEKNTMERLVTELNKQNGLAIGGLESVLEALKIGAVEVALAVDNSDLNEIIAMCKKCGLSKSEIVHRKDAQAIQHLLSSPCERCQAVEYEVVEKDIVDVLEDAASQTDARVEVYSAESEEKMKLTSFGGFAALLRYKP